MRSSMRARARAIESFTRAHTHYPYTNVCMSSNIPVARSGMLSILYHRRTILRFAHPPGYIARVCARGDSNPKRTVKVCDLVDFAATGIIENQSQDSGDVNMQHQHQQQQKQPRDLFTLFN